MVRAPCCEKMGLKRGPWTRDEDRILINHITLHGHGNWRALPKQAGLLRCGKSCRLRWINYLRPDIKRGNFSEEEEETIINLHEVLGNRWSAIAAKLPGRTDNEIKNVWHTHLKKRIIKKIQESTPTSNNAEQSSDSRCTTSTVEDNSTSSMNEDPSIDFFEVDDTFWSEVFSSTENSSSTSTDFVADHSAGTATSEFNGDKDMHIHFPKFDDNSFINMNTTTDDMDNFWYNMLTSSSGQLQEL